MALFSGADENEIKKRKLEQDRTQAELEQREADVVHRQKLNEDVQQRLKEEQDATAAKNIEAEKRFADREKALFEREQAVTRQEIAVSAGSVEQQRSAFREAVEGKLHALDERAVELDALEQRLAKELESITQKDGELSRRELSVHEREQKADAGFAERVRSLREVSEAREATCAARETRIHARETELMAEHASQESRAEELRKREEQLVRAEQERDAGFAELRRALDQDLRNKRQAGEAEIDAYRSSRLAAIDKELAGYRSQRLDAVAKEEQTERERTHAALTEEHKVLTTERQTHATGLATAKKELEERRGQLAAQGADLAFREALLGAKDTALAQRTANLENEVQKLVVQRRESFVAKEATLEAECLRLRAALTQTDAMLGCFQELKKRLGDREAEEVLLDLNSKTDELKRLREQLANRPTEEMRQQFSAQAAEKKRLEARVEELSRDAMETRQRLVGENELRAKLSITETNNKALSNRAEILGAECNRQSEELKRMRAAYEREEDREARIRDIELPHPDFKVTPPIRKGTEKIDEIQWLDAIGQSCVDYGLRFHPRILRAFHTAIKTAEWSPLTIMAGVSGTGKSELPRLYAHFGGMPFVSMAVQPNWDSQESMLGFFNSIDNRFDAQAILRFLAQSQKKNGDDYPGLQDAVCMVLLDEMNLAHAELYFAEFLSKLELRRGKKGTVPRLDIKLGAGLAPYELPLGRNVLWTGTMNQDETTKSLSDKVLDRSIVIHFPRPTTLERRKALKPLPEAAPLLPRKVWESWWMRESNFSDEEVRPFKSFIEEMNQSLSKVGRALGHRVWQSIEYYMANYPDVLHARKAGDQKEMERAMRVAFEDQLVQKVMPKLRGIETRSPILNKIRDQIVNERYALVEDFELACELGYGQFIWQSANYLSEPEAAAPAPAVVAEPATALPTSVEVLAQTQAVAAAPLPDLRSPPPSYRRGEPELSRNEKWSALPERQRRMLWEKP